LPQSSTWVDKSFRLVKMSQRAAVLRSLTPQLHLLSAF